MDVLSADEQEALTFHLPAAFLRLARLGLVRLEPWKLLDRQGMLDRRAGLAERYPERAYVPFATRQDMDEVACWDAAGNDDRVIVVHDFASPGWEVRREYDDVYGWLQDAVADFIEFDGGRARRSLHGNEGFVSPGDAG